MDAEPEKDRMESPENLLKPWFSACSVGESLSNEDGGEDGKEGGPGLLSTLSATVRSVAKKSNMKRTSKYGPKRAFLLHYDNGKAPPHRTFKCPPESRAVARVLRARGVEVLFKTPDEMLRRPPPLKVSDMVVGDMAWIRLALGKFNIPMPRAPDYPDCLKHLLRRRIWTTTLGEVCRYLEREVSSKGLDKTPNVFIKPATDTKLFNGLVEPRDQMIQFVAMQFPKSLSVVCSEIVDMVSEYRAYCINGVVKSIAHYLGPDMREKLDAKLIHEAGATLFKHRPDLAGCGLDFAVVKKSDGAFETVLIEVNDGYALGIYEEGSHGIGERDYTDMLIARWRTLVAAKKKKKT